jgi:hypothetical protein
LMDQAKQQLQTEVIFLIPNDRLHEVILRWHPRNSTCNPIGAKAIRPTNLLMSSLVFVVARDMLIDLIWEL